MSHILHIHWTERWTYRKINLLNYDLTLLRVLMNVDEIQCLPRRTLTRTHTHTQQPAATRRTNEKWKREKTLKIVFREFKISSSLKLATVYFQRKFITIARKHLHFWNKKKSSKKQRKDARIREKTAFCWHQRQQRFAPTQLTTSLSRQQPRTNIVCASVCVLCLTFSFASFT